MAIKLDQSSLNAARMILEHPLVVEIIQDLEDTAMNAAINSKPGDEIKPVAYLAEIRAIRAFKSSLEFIISEAPSTIERESQKRP